MTNLLIHISQCVEVWHTKDNRQHRCHRNVSWKSQNLFTSEIKCAKIHRTSRISWNFM